MTGGVGSLDGGRPSRSNPPSRSCWPSLWPLSQVWWWVHWAAECNKNELYLTLNSLTQLSIFKCIFEVSSKPLSVSQFLLDSVSFKNLKCAGIITTVPYRSRSCCPCSAPGRRPGTTGWSRGDASCECRRAPGPSLAPHTSPRRALGSADPACAPDALSARFLSGWSPGGPCTLQSTPLQYRWEVRRCLVIVQRSCDRASKI